MRNDIDIKSMAAVFMLATSLGGCSIFSGLQNIGKAPEISPIENPTEAEDYKPVSMPMPKQKEEYQTSGANSLWKKGSTGFFKDQRAANIGDIITVKISAKDAAKLENETEQNRDDNSDTMSVGSLAGYEKYIGNKFLPTSANKDSLLDISSNREISSDGKIDRKENINVTMAATVTQVLPNGNLVIVGTQEIRVNYELRQLGVQGIIRRADISSDNSIESSKIAELRVSYGGKGTLSDIQQPRYGRQIIDIIAPF